MSVKVALVSTVYCVSQKLREQGRQVESPRGGLGCDEAACDDSSEREIE